VVGSQPTTTSAIIEAGKAAQRQLDRGAAQTWTAWRDICLALSAIQQQALAVAKAKQPRGRKYHRAVRHRLRLHGFERYDKSARSRMVEVARNLGAIDAWRATLSPEQLTELNYPRVVLTLWKQSLRPKPANTGKKDEHNESPLAVALQASSGWDDKLWTALLEAKDLDWLLRIMPATWRLQLLQRAGMQFMRAEQKRDPNKRLKNWKPAVVGGADVTKPPTTH
jgi:hypothetical protein